MTAYWVFQDERVGEFFDFNEAYRALEDANELVTIPFGDGYYTVSKDEIDFDVLPTL